MLGVEAWGIMDARFTFKTVAFVWIKQNRRSDVTCSPWATGRGQRGDLPCWRPRTPEAGGADVKQVILSHERTARSRRRRGGGSKPSWGRSRIELFGKSLTPPGWDVGK